MGFFIHRMTRNLFGGFLLRRLLTDFRGCDLFGRCRYPLRLKKVPQISQIYTDFFIGVFCPTDFTDIHRFFLGRFFCHADFADDADFFLMGFFIHRMTRNLFGDFLLRRLLTDFRGCDLSGRYRYPLRLTKRFTRDSIKNLCKSVKSVGQNPSTKKNLRHQRNLRDQNNRSIYRARVIGQRPKFCEIP